MSENYLLELALLHGLRRDVLHESEYRRLVVRSATAFSRLRPWSEAKVHVRVAHLLRSRNARKGGGGARKGEAICAITPLRRRRTL